MTLVCSYIVGVFKTLGIIGVSFVVTGVGLLIGLIFHRKGGNTDVSDDKWY